MNTVSDQDARPIPYLRVLGPVVAVSLLLVGLCIGGFVALSAMRAYVGGESVWAKARAEAVGNLWRFALTRDPDDHVRFLRALEPMEADRIARLELESADPDYELAAAALVRGGNQPSDVPSMILLYRCCHGVPRIRDAIGVWEESDAMVDELRAAGESLRGAVNAGAQVGPHLGRLSAVDEQLIDAGRRFSAGWSAASRVLAVALIAGVLGLTLVSVWIVTAIARRDLKRHSEQKLQLARANRRWELAAGGGGLGMFEWDVESDRMQLDERACALVGLGGGPGWHVLERIDVRRMIHPDDQARTRAALERAADHGQMFVERFRVQRPDGQVRHLEGSGMVEVLPQTRMVGVLRDVTGEVERGQIELERTAAERVDRARIEFLSRLSHELRTPLNAVLGFSELMLHDPKDPLSTPQRVRLSYVMESGAHLLKLVNEVLDMSRIDAGGVGVQLAAVEVVSVLQAAQQLVEAECRGYGITIVEARADPAWCVWADRQRLTQALANLMSNGCKYNRRGGSVFLDVRREEHDTFVSVRDEGEGLPEESLAQLFQPFRRLHTSSGIAGTGLGLVIVKLLMEKMGGAVHVTSRVGQGTTFTLRLRSCDAPPPDVPEASEHQAIV